MLAGENFGSCEVELLKTDVLGSVQVEDDIALWTWVPIPFGVLISNAISIGRTFAIEISVLVEGVSGTLPWIGTRLGVIIGRVKGEVFIPCVITARIATLLCQRLEEIPGIRHRGQAAVVNKFVCVGAAGASTHDNGVSLGLAFKSNCATFKSLGLVKLFSKKTVLNAFMP